MKLVTGMSEPTSKGRAASPGQGSMQLGGTPPSPDSHAMSDVGVQAGPVVNDTATSAPGTNGCGNLDAGEPESAQVPPACPSSHGTRSRCMLHRPAGAGMRYTHLLAPILTHCDKIQPELRCSPYGLVIAVNLLVAIHVGDASCHQSLHNEPCSHNSTMCAEAEVATEESADVAAKVQECLLDAFAAGTEGLMLKALDGPSAGYQPSRRSESWLKVKKCAHLPLISDAMLLHPCMTVFLGIYPQLAPISEHEQKTRPGHCMHCSHLGMASSQSGCCKNCQ